MRIIARIKHKIILCMRRKINHKVAYNYPPTAKGWVKYERSLLGGEKTGTYYDPCVRKVHDKYVMIVSHRDSRNIIRYDSIDGINWEKPVVILEHEDLPVCRASFVIKDGVWYLWYTTLGESYNIELATSEDGHYFERYKGNPVLVPTLKMEKDAVMNPSVMLDNNTFKMWYAAGGKFEPDVLCYAESIDGVAWNKKEEPVLSKSEHLYDCCKVGGCDVIKSVDGYLMYYIGYQNIDTARICEAFSIDGMVWHRSEKNPIVSPTPNGWDADSVYKPTIVIEEGKITIWYNGRKNHQESIGLVYKER